MDETVREWREAEQAGGLVVLDGFHALKHALRFGADVRMVVAEDPAAVRALARELAPDVEAAVGRLARRADLKGVLPRVHPTGVAALAVRPDRAAGIAGLGRLPGRRPWSSSTTPATSATSEPSSASPPASAPPVW